MAADFVRSIPDFHFAFHGNGNDLHDFLLVADDALCQQLDGTLQILALEDVGDTHLVDALAGGLVEGCAGGKHDGVALVVELLLAGFRR